MINKTDILNLVKHVHRKGQGIPDRKQLHPQREWFIGLLFFVVVTSIGTVVSIKTFDAYKNIDSQAYEVEISVPSYNHTLAQTVLTQFASRKAEYDRLVGGVAQPVVVEELATSTLASTTPSTATSTSEVVTTETPEETVPVEQGEGETAEAEEDVPVFTAE